MTENEKGYKELFLGEVRDHLAKLNDLFLRLEKKPGDIEGINEAFRIMHTIKGDSAMLGLKDIAECAHKGEDLLASLRDSKVPPDQRFMDKLFGCVDRIERMIADFEGQNKKENVLDLPEANKGEGGLHCLSESPSETKRIEAEKIRKLEKVIGRIETKMNETLSGFELRLGGEQRPNSGGGGDLCAAKDGRAPCFRAIIKVEIEEPLKPLRAFNIMKALAECGELVSTEPATDALAAGKFGEEIIALVTACDPEELKEKLRKIQGVLGVEVQDSELPSGFSSNEKISALEKISLIDRLVSAVENVNKEGEAATITVDDIKGRHKVEEIKVKVSSLDKLFNLTGELVLAKSRMGNLVKQYEVGDIKEVYRFIEGIVSDLQAEVMNLRLMPIGQVFNIFPRMVRDLAKSAGKEIDLIIEGSETAVDRKILEEIVDPVVHIIRNAIDHGIESPSERVQKGKNAVGTIKIVASRDASHFILEIEDDGRGIDPKKVKETAVDKGLITKKKADELEDQEALYLVCVPGFSTKREVSQLSGRGMGMSAVKNKIEGFGGTISISSEIGSGTKITIRLPASMVTIKIIVVGVGGQYFGIPVSDVSEIVEISREDIKFVQGAPFINLRGKIIRLYRLSWLLGIEEGICKNYLTVIIRRGEGNDYGLLVSEVKDEDEVAMKPLPKILKGVNGFLGSAILGDGKPTFIIDVVNLV